MKKKSKTAILLGATGLTGNLVLNLLINDSRYSKIKLFSRTSIGFSHPKIEEHLVTVVDLLAFKSEFYGDEVFCCIGTTKAKTPNNNLYRQIDYGIPVNAGLLCKENNIDTLIIISALGANSKSNFFYNRLKGEMENAVLRLGIINTYILQPSLISGSRKEKRTGEWVFKQLMKVLNVLLVGSFSKYKSIKPVQIAKAMIWLANNNYDSSKIPSNLIQQLAE